jgi:hypothetical protein
VWGCRIAEGADVSGLGRAYSDSLREFEDEETERGYSDERYARMFSEQYKWHRHLGETPADAKYLAQKYSEEHCDD